MITIIVRELLIGLGFSLDESKLKKADKGISSIKNHAETAVAALSKMAAVIGLALGVTEVTQMADAWTNVDSRIGLVTKSTQEQAEVQQKVFDIAQKTRQEYTATGDLFFKLSRGAQDFGGSQDDVLKVTETVNKALVVGGASAVEAKATILQLSQALASGRLQGDELRSLSENASELMREIAKAYGVSVGQLKKMGAEGELTAEGVFKAILSSKAKMDKEFEKMPVTIEQSVTYAMNRIGKVIFGINKETSVFQYIAKGIMKAADGIAGSIERGARAVGGFTNAVKLLVLAFASLRIAMFIFKYPITYLPRIIVLLRSMALAIAAVSRAAWLLVVNPLFWEAALIAAGISLIVLAVEDLYYWITGGESALGDWLGTWEQFKDKVVKWMDDVALGVKAGAEKGAKFWKDVFGALADWTINLFKRIAASFPKMNFGVSPGTMPGAAAVTPQSMFPSGGFRPISVTQNFDFNQAISTNQPVTEAIRGANLTASKDAMGLFSRGIENYVFSD